MIKKYTIYLAALSIIIGLDAAYAVSYPHTDSANTGNWVLVEGVSDEFTNGLDHAKWQVCGKDGVFWAGSFTGRGYTEGAYPENGSWQYSPDNVQVTNGLLKITTQYEPEYPFLDPGAYDWKFTTGGMWSKQTVPYGYMEIRCKLAYEEQTGAFWTTGAGVELDVFEAIGKHASRQNKMWSTLHDWSYPNPNKVWTETSSLSFDFSDGYHTYAAEWDINSVKFYADGVLIHSVTSNDVVSVTGDFDYDTWPLGAGHHIWADSEIFPWWGVPDTNNAPSDFEVEYIRVWEKGPPPSSPWDTYFASYGISGVKTNHSDADGLNDWTEYLIGGDPTNPSDVGILPVFDAASSNFAYSLRNDASLIAYIYLTTNLTDGIWITNDTFAISNNDGMMSNYVSETDMSEAQLFMKLAVAETSAPPPVTPTHNVIINGPAIGNGDLQSGSPANGAHPYSAVPNWFNASGAESVDGISDVGTNGSSQPTGTHALLPFNQRIQISDSGYTIVAAGEVFSLSYEFGAYGGPTSWDNVETNRTFLFTSTAPVNGSTVEGNITELGGDEYPIDRAGDGQWTTRIVPNFYTTTAGDIGKTVYFGIEFIDGQNGSDNNLFPRIDVIELEVNKP